MVRNGAVGAALTRDAQLNGVAFTGSTATARHIRNMMATHLHPGAPLIAEQGEINTMIVDSTALPEQAVAIIIESAFQSASQRCSALRCVYVQEDIATFASADIDNVIKAINAAGYDLTFGSQSRISNRVADISKRISANNIYVNRNQIGAVVGSQPFGGRGLQEPVQRLMARFI